MKTITASQLLSLLCDSGLDRDTLEMTAVAALKSRAMKVATAESCTGGLLSERITRVSGASEVFDCGVCSYANAVKAKVLGVSEETLRTVGAVSPETAVQMAQGVRLLADADIGISTTGIAGPTGGTVQKPVGLVFMGVCTETEAYAIKLLLGEENTRDYIRAMASSAALFTVLSEAVKFNDEW